MARLYCQDCGEDPRAAQVQLKLTFTFYKADRGSGNLILNIQKAVRFTGVSQHNQVESRQGKKKKTGNQSNNAGMATISTYDLAMGLSESRV